MDQKSLWEPTTSWLRDEYWWLVCLWFTNNTLNSSYQANAMVGKPVGILPFLSPSCRLKFYSISLLTTFSDHIFQLKRFNMFLTVFTGTQCSWIVVIIRNRLGIIFKFHVGWWSFFSSWWLLSLLSSLESALLFSVEYIQQQPFSSLFWGWHMFEDGWDVVGWQRVVALFTWNISKCTCSYRFIGWIKQNINIRNLYLIWSGHYISGIRCVWVPMALFSSARS